jgi:hypothetical protein
VGLTIDLIFETLRQERRAQRRVGEREEALHEVVARPGSEQSARDLPVLKAPATAEAGSDRGELEGPETHGEVCSGVVKGDLGPAHCLGQRLDRGPCTRCVALQKPFPQVIFRSRALLREGAAPP